MDFSKLNFGVDGDSITADKQWSWYVYENLGLKSHYNVAVGSSVWYKRTITTKDGAVTTQNFDDPDFAGISGGWEETDDLNELQMRANNCAVVHTQKFIHDVKAGLAPIPDIFAFAMGTNDSIDALGDADTALMGKTLDNVNIFNEAGAMRWCIQRICEEFPQVRVFILTPIQTATPEHNDKIRKQIPIMRTIANAFGAHVIDCFNECAIIEKFETIGGAGKYLRDGLHPDYEGQCLEGRFALKEIRNNMY